MPGLDEWLGQQEPQDFPVWEENWQSLTVFLALQTQWRWTGGMEPRRAGFDYNVFPLTFEMFGVRKKDRPEIFDDLRVMETAALQVWAGMAG